VAQWLGSLPVEQRLPLAGQRVVDYGCGSGVLAIAAALLGAEHLFAVDIDPQALLATRQNAVANGVNEAIETSLQAPSNNELCDLLMANILFQPLMQLSDQFAAMLRPGGRVVLSGLLEEQMEPLSMRYNAAFEIESEKVQDGWAMLVASRRKI